LEAEIDRYIATLKSKHDRLKNDLDLFIGQILEIEDFENLSSEERKTFRSTAELLRRNFDIIKFEIESDGIKFWDILGKLRIQ